MSSRFERLFDLALGVSIVGWGAAALLHAPTLAPVRIAIVAVNLAVGALVAFRRAPDRGATFFQIALALPAVAAGGVALLLAPPPESWPPPAAIMVVAGALFTLVAFAFLGRSFAVFPSRRRIVVHGPYALLRHPAYLGELTMVSGALLAAGPVIAACSLPTVVFLLVLRIRAEESLLSECEAYQTYAADVRWRLLPLVW